MGQSPHNSSLAPGNVVGGQYRIEAALGHGAMGDVYLGEDLHLKRKVAIKTLKTELLEHEKRAQFLLRFEQEALFAAGISHPAILGIYNFGKEGEHTLWYAMEYIENSTTLEEHINLCASAGQPMSLEDIRRCFLCAADGLIAIHAEGVTHRDIKSKNLLVYMTHHGLALKIIDFGVAHMPMLELTQTGEQVGTPSHFAPEVIRAFYAKGKAINLPRVDLFALGVALYRALTGTSPFNSENHFTLWTSILKDVPPAPSTFRPDLPRSWDWITMRLLEKNPERRYQDARELYDHLMRPELVSEFIPSIPERTSADQPTNSLGAPPTELPELSDVGSLQAPPPVDEQSSQSRSIAPAGGLVGDAAAFERLGKAAPVMAARQAPAIGRLRALPRGVRYGLFAAGVVVVLLVIAVLAALQRPPVQMAKPILDAKAAEPTQPAVTAAAILDDQNRVRTDQLISTQRELEIRRQSEKFAQLSASSGAAPQAAVDEPRPQSGRGGSRSRSNPVVGNKAKPELIASNVATPALAAVTAEQPRRKRLDQVASFYKPSEAPQQSTGGAKLGIPTGTMTEARLTAPLSSDATNTIATAVLPNGLALGELGLVIPKGSLVIGRATYRAIGDQGRVEIQFTRLVTPDRNERAINAIAVLANGEAGLVAQVTKRDDRTAANLGEAALDVVDSVLSEAPGSQSSSRFTRDKRQDAQNLRQGRTTMTVAANYKFKVQFTQPL